MLKLFLISILIISHCYLQPVFANQLANAKQLAATIPQLHDQEFAIAPLSGGLTNLIYLVKTNSQHDYVLRIFGAEASALGINPITQAEIAVRVGELNVGPKVVYLSADKKLMLLEFAPGRTIDRSVYNSHVIHDLTIKLRKLHEQGNFSNTFDLFTTAKHYRQIALSKTEAITAAFPLVDMNTAEQIVNKIQAIIAPHSQQYQRSAHNDLHCGNILYDIATDKLSILDLDYAGVGDLFFDLATFANSMNLDAHESSQLLAFYFAPRSITPRDEAHFYIMRLMSTYWNSMWYFSQVGSSSIQHDHLHDATQKLKSFLQQSDTAMFQQWLQVLA